MTNAAVVSARPRALRGLTASLAGLVALCITPVLVGGPAAAAPGPAPGSQERTIIGDVHTDAISTFWDAGQLVLASKADTPSLGTRYEADDIWFHVDNDSRVASWPAGAPSFVAPAGSTVWMAPQTQAANQIWPGFSTESVPTGTLQNDDTTITLQNVDGPGDVELWQTGTFGSATRLLSSDENFKSITRKRVHMHANWAFTQPGVYRLTFRADAVVASSGAPTSDTAVYTFVVGDLPEPVLTTTTLESSASEIGAGDPVTLTAEVSPAAVEDVDGAVEFRDGATVLGHDPIDEAGTAELTVPDLPVGVHDITAVFVPETTNLATGSTSPPVTVTVTDGSGTPFGVAGVQDSYQPGDTLNATAVGVTLEPDQRLKWLLRVAGESEYYTGDPADTFSRDLTASDDGYELAVSVWQCAEWDEYCNGNESTMVTQSPWVPITVNDIGAAPVAQLTSPADAYAGDVATLTMSGRELAPDETLQVVRRSPSSPFPEYLTEELFDLDGTTMSVYLQQGGEFAVRVLDGAGLAIAQSEPVAIEAEAYEVQISQVQGLYRPGATLQAQGIIHPERSDLHYEWSFYSPGVDYYTVEEGVGAEARSTEIPDLTLAHDAGVFFLNVSAPIAPPFVDEPGLFRVGSKNARVYVQDIDPGTQIFQFQPLGDHYHQGNPINLVLGADPVPAAGDEVVWEWMWPGTGWTPLPGASGLSHELTAEQAMAGVQVRATLDYADDAAESVVAGPVTIHHDDHGAPPRQQPTVDGKTGYVVGESLSLSLGLPENGQTVLTEQRWERKAADSQDWAIVAGQTGEELALPATLGDDGASYRVSILKPNGDVAYGPSPAVTLTVNPETATELAIAGVEDTYEVGDVLRARVVGRPLETGQTWRWIIRPVGATSSGYVFYGDGDQAEAAQGRLRQLLDAGHDGYEIRARLRQGSAYVAGVDTAWVPIQVDNAVEPVTTTFPAGDFYLGDVVELPLSRPLAQGESVRLVSRFSSPWSVVDGTTVAGDALVWRAEWSVSDDTALALQVVRDGVVVAISEPFTGTIADREVVVQGMRSVYRVGQTMSLSADVHPPKDGLLYRWSTFEYDPVTGEFDFPVIEEGTGPEALTVDVPMTMEWNDQPIIFYAIDTSGGGEIVTGGWSSTVTVSDAPAGEQLFFFENLSGHYHQGNTINLNLVADPQLDEGDTVSWEWQWPGEEWAPFPSASGVSHQLTAEQALDGVQVRATLDYGDSDETLTTEPVTIHNDDHGAPARQQPTVAGETSVEEGETVTLTRQLPGNGPTVLTEHRWERKPADSEAWTVLEDQTGAELSFPATAADDGAAYRISVLKPGGTVAYGPSPAVTLSVSAATSIAGAVTDAGGAAVGGACVYAYSSRDAASASFATCAQPDGTYVMSVDAGEYVIAVNDPSGQHATTWLDTAVVVDGAETGVDVVLDELAAAQVTGTVVDSASEALGGICVYAYEDDVSSAASYASCTLGDGSFGLHSMESGAYDVAFADPAGVYVTQWHDGSTGGAPGRAGSVAVTLPTGSSTATADATMSDTATGSVTGTVTGPGGPLADVCVYLYVDGPPAGAAYASCTQADGTYYIGDVDPDADYKVGFADPSGTFATQWWTGAAGGAPSFAGGTVIADVTPGGSVSGVDAQMTP